MEQNLLKINDDKTELLLTGSSWLVKKYPSVSISVGESDIRSSASVKNLGMVFDSIMSMELFVKEKVKSANFGLSSIAKIRKYLTPEATKTICQALVVSKLDYANSLLHGINNSNLYQLQLLQNRAARLISRTKPWEHITPVLKDLHWLKIKERIEFSILKHVFKCLNDLGPQYLRDLLTVSKPSRELRSTTKSILVVPRCKSKMGERAFSISGPKLWNTIPEQIKEAKTILSFKKQLKTHYFTKLYC